MNMNVRWLVQMKINLRSMSMTVLWSAVSPLDSAVQRYTPRLSGWTFEMCNVLPLIWTFDPISSCSLVHLTCGYGLPDTSHTRLKSVPCVTVYNSFNGWTTGGSRLSVPPPPLELGVIQTSAISLIGWPCDDEVDVHVYRPLSSATAFVIVRTPLRTLMCGGK